MLQKQTVRPELLELLNYLMKQYELNDFVLVGGTGLALQIGHRISVDIDLFGKSELDAISFSEILSEFGNYQILKKSKRILIYSVCGIKVDFVDYRYPLLCPFETIEDIRVASK